MSETTAATTIETRVEASESALPAEAAPASRVPAETEADKMRRQLHVRRKIVLARRALAAHRR